MFKKTAGKKIFEFLKPSPNVPKTEIQKKIRDLKIETQKLKGQGKKLDQTAFELKNKLPLTFKTKKGKSESNKERYKRIQGQNTKVLKSMVDEAFNRNKESQKIFKKAEGKDVEKKATGGRVGRKSGGGTSLGMQSVKYGLDNNPNITAADPKAKFIAKNKSKKNMKKVAKTPMAKAVRKA